MRGSLFIKIFVGFWLISITVLGSWMLATSYFDARPPDDRPRQDKPEGPPHRFILRLIYGLQNASDDELPRVIQLAHDKHGIELYLLQKNGTDLMKKPVPEVVSDLAGQLQGPRKRAFEHSDGQRLSAHEIYRPEQGRLRLVLVFPGSDHDVLAVLGDNLWLRLLLAILISGLACFGMSRLMTNRLGELRLASRKLAGGDLDTRLLVREHGGDETDDVARDFNSMASQLQRRILTQKQLLSDVSHELRSPIARLRVALALAEEQPDKCSDHLRRIEQEIVRLEELIAQLLLSQQSGREMDKHIDLGVLLRQLCDDANFEGAHQNKSVSLSADIEQAIIPSSGDLLHKSFENIIRNALQHTARNTTVTVSLFGTDDSVVVTVDDCGPGVPEQQLCKLFDEFYRVDSARSHSEGGHGLGLSITRRAIEVHGGTVEAANTDTGMRVTVRLPRHL